MSDYSLQATWSTKDALATNQALKAISATELGTEFSAIATAVATKYDADDVASTVEARALTVNDKLITPSNLDDVFTENAGILGDLQAIASNDGNGDAILFLDDTDDTAKLLTIGNGIEISGTALQLPATLAGDGLTLTSGVLAVVGGAGITANANDIALTDAAASTSNPVDISSGAVTLDLTALTTMEGNALAAGDLILVDDGGTPKAIKVEEAGMRVQTAQTTQTVAPADMNTIMEFTGTAILTLPLNSTTALPIGVPIVLNMKHATQELTVTAAASVTLVSVYSPAGSVAASDTVRAGGTALLYKTAADVWCLSGDIST
jgi:hypothetical protein